MADERADRPGHADHDRLDRPLPEPVRSRVIGLASETLGDLPSNAVPAALRPFARFTPNRRRRLAASQLGTVLEHDTAFRQRVAERLSAELPELAAALEEGDPPPAAEPTDVAAAAFLLRPAGWPKLVAEVAEDLERAQSAAAGEREAETVRRLREQLNSARADARTERDRLRGEIGALKEENQALRQRLRQARDRAAAAERQAEQQAEEAEQTRAQARAADSRRETELRRLRTRLAEAEAAAEAARRSDRAERDLEAVRLRLLLDTVVEAAQGLRRELALPALGDQRPADTVAEAVPGTEPHLAAGVSVNDLLALPNAHLIVDGYNVTKQAWPEVPLSTQRDRLASGLGRLAARTRAEVTVVFDGANLRERPPVSEPRGVRVRFSPENVIADDLIRQLVAAEPAGRPVLVVSSDREVARSVRRSGARPVSSGALIELLGITPD